MPCASCKVANEVSIPVDSEQRQFAVRCHACQTLNLAKLDTGGEPILVAEGRPEWAHPPPEPPPTTRTTMPAKKRHKPAPRMPSTEVADDDDAMDELDASASAVPVGATGAHDDSDAEGEPLRAAPTGKAKVSAGKAKKVPAAPKAAAGGTKAKGASSKQLPSPPKKAAAAASSTAGSKGIGKGAGKTAGAMAASNISAKAKKIAASVAPAAAPAEPTVVRPAVIKLGSVVLAQFHDEQYYSGVVEDMQASHAACAAAASALASASAAASVSAAPCQPGLAPELRASLVPAQEEPASIKVAWDDGDPSSWVDSAHLVLAYRHARVPSPRRTRAGPAPPPHLPAPSRAFPRLRLLRPRA